MDDKPQRLPLYLPAQGATETEAVIIEWCLDAGDHFEKGQVLCHAESAKSVFDFRAPCSGVVVRLLHMDGETASFAEPVMEVETSDSGMVNWIPPAAEAAPAEARDKAIRLLANNERSPQEVLIRGVGGYLPKRVVTNAEIVNGFPQTSPDYIFEVTGVRERRWAADDEKPSDMALAASLDALRKSSVAPKEIDALIVCTTTPDVAMPSTACILQDRLRLDSVPAFDLNAACSGWLYGVSMAHAMIVAGMARNVLTVGVDLQSRLLDPADRNTLFIFGDGAGAAVVSASGPGHPVRRIILGTDARGLRLARRDEPGYFVDQGPAGADPWIRLDRQPLFRYATEGFAFVIRQAMAVTGWTAEETRWVIPHQANARMLKAAAKRCGVAFERFFMNIERVGNTSSASIPLALIEAESSLQPGDKIVLCSVGAGLTTAAVTLQW
jgi:3-oxoacyl-[acyl-carrier-protein] synthase-3